MTPKELKRLSRGDLLEILLDLSKENEKLRKGNEYMSEQLTDRNIAIEKCGSLAEAALQINNVFRQADKAAAQYLDYVKKFAKTAEQMYVKQYSEKKKEAESILMDARRQADEILDEAYRYAEEIIKQAKEGRCTDE